MSTGPQEPVHKSPARRHRPEIRPSSIPWALIANNVSIQFNETHPENTLEPDHFSLLSGLFRETISARWQQLDANDNTNDLESTSSQRTDNAAEPDVLLAQNPFLTAVSETIAPDPVPQRCTHHQNNESYAPINILEHWVDSRPLDAVMASLPPYQQAESLTDVFFTYLEANWYYFDERWFRDLLSQTYQEASITPQIHCTTLCLVFLVLALGECFMHVNQPPPVDSQEQDDALGGVPGGRFYQVAIGLMPSVLGAATVESVQCCLLTALYVLPMQSTSHHFTYLGLALRKAVSLSLHLNVIDNKITPESREVGVRVFWTAYCLERRSSIITGLPTMLQMRDITAPLPHKRSDLDKLRPQKVDRLIAFTKLTLAMNKVVEASPIDEKPDKFSRACSALEDWKQSLPAHLVALDPVSLRATAHLDIMYQMIWIYIGRAALLRLVRQRLHHRPEGSRQKPHLTPNAATQELAERCTRAAHAVIEWIDLLSHHNRLAKFSYTDFHSCSSAIIVLLLNEVLRASRDLHSSSIEHGINALRFMASGGQLAKDALHLVERLRTSVGKSNGYDNTRDPSAQDDSTLMAPHQNAAEHVLPSFSTPDAVTGYDASDFAKFDPALFSDLEPSLLQYSSQDLSLFGFDGFYPTAEADGSLWSWEDVANAELPL